MASSPAPELRRAAFWAGLAWLACCLVLLWLSHGRFSALAFRDPDDAMRLVQVRDWLAGQSFFDVSQHRVNPPYGGPMHWSRIVDMPIAALILLLRPLLGAANAELVACIAVPLLLLGGLVAAAFTAARRVAGSAVALVGVILLLTSPSILVQFAPLRIDHHGWQILLAGVALMGASDQRPARGGVIAALALATWLQISSEALPYAALFAGLFALRHWIERDQGPRFLAFAVTLGLAAAILLALLRGPGALLATHCDALSYAYVWPLVALALAAALAGRVIGLDTARRRLIVAALAGGAAVLTFLGTGGPCLAGDPFAALGPVAYRLWYLKVMEGRPIWAQDLAMRGAILLPALAGLAGALLAAWRSSGAARARWATLALLIVGATLVATLVMRALSVAHLFALPGIAWLIVLLFRRAQAARSPIIRVLGSAALVLLSPAGLSAGWIALVSRHPAEDKSAAADCRAQFLLAPLDRLPPATLFAPIDMGPDILLRTRHSVIATAHHRNVAGLTQVIRAFVADPQQARSIVAGSGATYLVGCDSLTELRSYARENPSGLAAMVRQGRAPDWLEPLPGKGPLRIWRISRAGS